MPRPAGHQAGAEAVRRVVEESVRLGVRVLTLFAFSSENWRRPRHEVSLLMDLFFRALKRELPRLKANGVRLRIIGDRTAFSDRLQQRMGDAETATAAGDRLLLQVAANYGGRWDITQAARALARAVRARELDPEAIDEDRFAAALTFADAGDPDLLFSPRDVEEVILSVAGRELRAITWWGGVLGALAGGVQSALVLWRP